MAYLGRPKAWVSGMDAQISFTRLFTEFPKVAILPAGSYSRFHQGGRMDIDGDKLRLARNELHMNQQQLAIAAGVGYSTIWVLETGRQTSAKGGTIEKIAAALGRTPESLAPEAPAASDR